MTLAAAASFAADLDSILQKVAGFEHGQSRAALVELQLLVTDSINSPEKVRAMEQRFDVFLKSNATLAGKDAVIRHVSLIGTEASVPVLAEMLIAPETSDMARYALERIRAAAAGEALLAALPKTSGKVRIGIINTLGMRREPAPIPALEKLAVNPEVATSDAAFDALARIGTPASADAILQAAAQSSEIRREALEALLSCADRLNDKTRATGIYKQLSDASPDELIRIGAMRGLARIQGKDALPALTQAIKSGSSVTKAALIPAVAAISGPEAGAALVDLLPAAPADTKVRLIAALGTRGDKSAAPSVLAFSKNEDENIRIAALSAAGSLGDATSVPVLVAAAASGSEREQTAARDSLYRLRGNDVDAAVLRELSVATGASKLELIRACGERGMASASDVLLKLAKDPDSAIRRESLKALRDTAGAAQVPALLALVSSAGTPNERRESERTLSTALRRSGNARIGDVLAGYRSAGSVETRASLLAVMGQAGHNDGLPVLRAALKDAAPEVRRAAILGLSDWPSAEPLSDLLGIAKDPQNKAHQVLALRGYIKLASLPSGRTPAQTIELLGTAFGLASQPEEKKAVLGLLPKYACPEAQKLAEQALADETVAKEAKSASDRVKRLLAEK